MNNNCVIDVVIPTHSKDIPILKYCISGIRKNVANVRRVIVVSKDKYTNDAEWFDESLYPFSYSEISSILAGANVGWNYQQLLKLYSPLVIPNISDNVLIVDSDTVFYRPLEFIKDGFALYNLSKDKDLEFSDFHQKALRHIRKILPDIENIMPEIFDQNNQKNFTKRLNFLDEKSSKNSQGLVSGVCHHMLFQSDVIKDLFSRIEAKDGEKFYEIFLKNREDQTGVSEYNLYFYFLVSCYPQRYKIRLLKYKNTARFFPLFEKIRKKYDYCSYHSYMRDVN